MFHSTTLKNGLTVIGETRESAVSVALGYFVKTGARDETPELSGVSHFLEHMMFKGTATRSALDVSYQLGALGAQANAFTSEENTVYYLAVLPEYFTRAFELLSDMLRPALDVGEFTVEKKVILEEIALYQDRPTHLLFEAALREHFRGHGAGNSVLGSIASVSALSPEQMRGYFDTRYAADNIVLAATGNFVWEELVELAERYCASWPRGTAGRQVREHIPVASVHALTKENLHRAHRCFVGAGPSVNDEERYAAHVLSVILGDSSGSRCFWELIDKGLADSASIDVDEMDGTGVVYGYVSSSPEKLDEVSEILRGILATPEQFGDDDLSRALTKIRTRTVLQGESSMRRLMAIGLDWIYRQSYVTLDEEIARIKRVDRAEIRRLLSRYDFQPKTVVSMTPA